ncbi:DUF1376 domain-containing protein [Bartonella sp. B17]
MSTKLPWTKLNAGEWMNEVSCLSPTEKCIYVMLRFQMLYAGEPLLNDAKALALYVGYPAKTFIKALDLLLLKKKIISLADGRLWNLDVEAELSDSREKSESASKAARTRWQKAKNKNDDDCLKENDLVYDPHIQMQCERDADVMHVHMQTECDAYNLHNVRIVNDAEHEVEQKEKKRSPPTPLKENKNKKTNTIVLAKKEKEMGSDNSETEDQVHEQTEIDVLENFSDPVKTSSENHFPIHQKNNEGTPDYKLVTIDYIFIKIASYLKQNMYNNQNFVDKT